MPLPLAESLAELAPKSLPFFGRHVLPLPAHLAPLFPRQRPEPLAGVANGLALFRGQFPESLESFALPRFP